ncbi:HAD hydrolase-like protein [Novosphingobium sp. FSY-8]|uniref:HAD hydrolase-like protein n=1 Tax=Novosphingobium ovatum TaxID=1908523 RepID=A0ABW9XDW5_9SPHN|nr:HAD hydrolase-like protein [Novosphingobium ovatum]NBC36697.1 HAD hydrolase-like protein [Novosphingobium ovatum]
MLPENLAERIASARGFIFDMDGTIALGDKASGGHVPLPGAVDLLATLRRRGVPFRVFTNGTAKPPATYAASLRNAGFDLADDEMMTPSVSAAIWLERQGLTRVRVLGDPGVEQPLTARGLEVLTGTDKGEVDAVYTAWFRGFTFPDLEAGCEAVWNGAALTTASHVPFFATANGRGIGSSFAINTMITALTDVPARVLGKPSQAAFDTALAAMGLDANAAGDVVVVGDDPALEMAMARGCGAIGIGLTTGLMRHETLATLPPDQQPHALLDDIADITRAL